MQHVLVGKPVSLAQLLLLRCTLLPGPNRAITERHALMLTTCSMDTLC